MLENKEFCGIVIRTNFILPFILGKASVVPFGESFVWLSKSLVK
jgi:hypothetical protein